MKIVDFSQLTESFPWSELYDNLGYAMPYPEVIMTSDRAYALYTQIAGLLMMEGWELGNTASYELERIDSSHEAYMLTTKVELASVNEAWGVIGIAEQTLHAYIHMALVNYVGKNELTGKNYTSTSLGEGRYMLVVESIV